MVLALIWSRGEPVVGHDSFGYLELTKQFRETAPTHFGDWWPFGFPLLASILTHLGLSAFASLVAVSTIAYFAMVWWFWRTLPKPSNDGTAATVLLAVVCAPACPVVLCMILSEPLFSAFLFGLALCLGRWASKATIVGSMVMAMAAFGVRYVGAFAIGLVGMWALLQWNRLKQVRLRGFFVGTYIATILVIAGLCYLNYRYSGAITGPHPVGREHLSSWPYHLADFGWSSVAAFISSGLLPAVGGISSPMGFGVGVIIVATLYGYLFIAWKRRTSETTTAMVLLVVIYSLAMVTLRSTTRFDNLSSARTFLPVLFPLAYLIATDRAVRLRQGATAAACVIVAGAWLLAVRGISPDVKPDVSAAKSALSRVLKPGQTVAVNGAGRALAAAFANHFQPPAMGKDGVTALWEQVELWDPANSDFTVVVRPPKPESSPSNRINWESAISQAVNSGQADVIAGDNTFVLVARKTSEQKASKR